MLTIHKKSYNYNHQWITNPTAEDIEKLINVPIAKWDQIEELELDNYHIEKLPDEINLLVNLKQLRLPKNSLETLPNTIGDLKKLEILNLHANNITHLPKNIVGCINLRLILLSSNKLEEFPEELCNLPNIVEIDVSNNKLEKLPKSIGNLTTLEYLNLDFNNLKKIPKNINRCKNMLAVNLGGNKFKKKIIPSRIIGIANGIHKEKFMEMVAYEFEVLKERVKNLENENQILREEIETLQYAPNGPYYEGIKNHFEECKEHFQK